jgi:hypothetical protein
MQLDLRDTARPKSCSQLNEVQLDRRGTQGLRGTIHRDRDLRGTATL